MRKFCHCLLLLSLPIITWAQDCPPIPTSGLRFETQMEVDNFKLTYPNCTILNGDLFIWGLGALDPIVDLSGFSNITHITGFASFFHMESLTNADLPNLVTIGRAVSFSSNDNLLSINFDSLETLEEFRILGNPQLAFINSPNLSGSLVRISISQSNLVSLNFLDGITEVISSISLFLNPNLADISFVEDVNLAELVNLTITLNPLLSICEYESLCIGLNATETSEVSNNNVGCLTEDDICNNLSLCFFTASNGDWDNPNNWSGGLIPDQDCDVYILNNAICDVPNGTNAICRTLTVDPK